MNKKQKRNQKVHIVTLVLLVFSLFLLLGGVTFAVYYKFMKGSTNNIIQAGTISFAYNEDAFQGNGVYIENADRISDAAGKSLNGTHQYFDFSVNATASAADVSYQVSILKQDQSDLLEDIVKVYVTTKNGNSELASPLVEQNGKVLTFQELPRTNDGNGRVVYNGVVQKSNQPYHQEFRLRLWIADDRNLSAIISDKVFSVKVKVVATEVH